MTDKVQEYSTRAKPIPDNCDQNSSGQYVRMNDPDEINLLEYIYVLVKNKWWIIGAAVLGLVVGYALFVLQKPTYESEVIIAAKESESQKSPNFSSLGALGGIVASQLNIANSPGLDKIDQILGSRKFNAELIKKYDLLPQVFRNQFPKQYKLYFDSAKNEWKKEFIVPNLLSIGSAMKVKFLKKGINKDNTMVLKIVSRDSTFCDTLLSYYLQYLNVYIQTSVKNDAKENVSFLENQLISIADPLLREKLQSMIASELEKEMLISKEAFTIIDPPIRQAKYKIKMQHILILSFAFSFIIVVIITFSYALQSAQKTEEDRILLSKIKSGLFLK